MIAIGLRTKSFDITDRAVGGRSSERAVSCKTASPQNVKVPALIRVLYTDTWCFTDLPFVTVDINIYHRVLLLSLMPMACKGSNIRNRGGPSGGGVGTAFTTFMQVALTCLQNVTA